MKSKLLILIISIVFIQSCSDENNYDSNHIGIKVDLPNQVLDSFFVGNSIMIPLETRKDVLLGYILEVVKDDNNIYILDQFRKNIYCFDLNGKYMGGINKQGKGPYEYIRISSFSIYGNEIYILTLNKVIVYDKHTYKPIRETKLDNLYAKSLWVGKGNFVLSTNNYFTRHTLNYALKKNGKVHKKLLPTKIKTNDEKIALSLGGFKFSPIEGRNSALFNIAFSNNIYTVLDTGYHCSYTIDFRGKDIPTNILSKDPMTIKRFLENKENRYSRIYNAFQSKDVLAVCLESRLPEINYNSYLIKNNLNTMWINRLYHKELELNFRIIGSSSNGFIGCIESSDIVNRRNKLVQKQWNENKLNVGEKKFLEVFSNESNPCLVIFDFEINHVK